jgi:hypothetical protein
VIGGTAKTCRRSTPASAAWRSPRPHPRRHTGSSRSTSSGLLTCDNERPCRPACPPGLRPEAEARRNDFGDVSPGHPSSVASTNSVNFPPKRDSKSANRAFSRSISAACAASGAASSSYVGFGTHRLSAGQSAGSRRHTANHVTSYVGVSRSVQSLTRTSDRVAYTRVRGGKFWQSRGIRVRNLDCDMVDVSRMFRHGISVNPPNGLVVP